MADTSPAQHQAAPTARRPRSNARRRRDPTAVAPTGPAYIKRQIPYYDFLSEEALVRIENHADWLLQEIGIEFRDDPVALDIWREAGADVDGVRVRLPSEIGRAHV